jgi:hypothetical protein
MHLKMRDLLARLENAGSTPVCFLWFAVIGAALTGTGRISVINQISAADAQEQQDHQTGQDLYPGKLWSTPNRSLSRLARVIGVS